MDADGSRSVNKEEEHTGQCCTFTYWHVTQGKITQLDAERPCKRRDKEW